MLLKFATEYIKSDRCNACNEPFGITTWRCFCYCCGKSFCSGELIKREYVDGWLYDTCQSCITEILLSHPTLYSYACRIKSLPFMATVNNYCIGPLLCIPIENIETYVIYDDSGSMQLIADKDNSSRLEGLNPNEARYSMQN